MLKYFKNLSTVKLINIFIQTYLLVPNWRERERYVFVFWHNCGSHTSSPTRWAAQQKWVLPAMSAVGNVTINPLLLLPLCYFGPDKMKANLNVIQSTSPWPRISVYLNFKIINKEMVLYIHYGYDKPVPNTIRSICDLLSQELKKFL